jgi:YVTN family beta-propeller protein
MDLSRRTVLQTAALGALALSAGPRATSAQAPGGTAIGAQDRVFIANEDSNTISVIDHRSNAVETTINLTSFDEDPRPPFRFVTGGVTPTRGDGQQAPLSRVHRGPRGGALA